jgi:hypothetical protein
MQTPATSKYYIQTLKQSGGKECEHEDAGYTGPSTPAYDHNCAGYFELQKEYCPIGCGQYEGQYTRVRPFKVTQEAVGTGRPCPEPKIIKCPATPPCAPTSANVDCKGYWKTIPSSNMQTPATSKYYIQTLKQSGGKECEHEDAGYTGPSTSK